MLNGGAVLGALIGSRFADRFGPKPVVASCFLIGAVSIALLTLSLPLGLLLLFVAIVGLGTSGTQTLIYGFVANYFRTNVRGAGVAWCAGFGRLGGVGGPLLGGLLVAAGLALNSIFYVWRAGRAGRDPDPARADPLGSAGQVDDDLRGPRGVRPWRTPPACGSASTTRGARRSSSTCPAEPSSRARAA